MEKRGNLAGGFRACVTVTDKYILDALFGGQAGRVQGKFKEDCRLDVGIADAGTTLLAGACDYFFGIAPVADDFVVV